LKDASSQDRSFGEAPTFKTGGPDLPGGETIDFDSSQ
jgi:hypothetical protein